LITALSDSKPLTRRNAVLALGAYGPAAASAIPALILMLQNPARFDSEAASQALKQIDPEAASKAGVK
jgi:HEAT repeat protein